LVGGLAGLGLAVALRVSVAGAAGAGSATAGLVFGTALLVLALVCDLARPELSTRQLMSRAAVAAALCAVPMVRRIVDGGVAEPAGMLPLWAAVVTYVAVAEELLLRGALFERALARFENGRGRGDRRGVRAAARARLRVAGAAAGPRGRCLSGALRLVASSVTAPAVAHTLADLAGWWLR
jgi:hypothetical protein